MVRQTTRTTTETFARHKPSAAAAAASVKFVPPTTAGPSIELVTDERTAGEMWRAETYREFLFRAKVSGIDGEPEIVEALRAMKALNETLSAMDAEQRASEVQGPWWRDGEYDAMRAESRNDEGMIAMTAKAYVKAFEAFTEAIRLEPRKAVYHANRAAAGIALGRFEVAADDAQCAIERDGTYFKALIRAGKANLKLRRPEKALEMFRRALECNPNDAGAERGALEALHAFEASNKENERQRDAALHGSRTALPRHDVAAEAAAEALLYAEATLRANPTHEGAKANVAEALVTCQRYEMALDQCKTLLESSLDRKYIISEARWRMGDLDGALAEISTASFRDSYDDFACKKCVELGARLLHLQDWIHRAERDFEDAQYTSAMRVLNTILNSPEGKMTTRFRGRVLRMRAECLFKSREYDGNVSDDASFAAVAADLNECLALNGKDFETYILRASMRTTRQDYHGAFTDLRSAQTIEPHYPGIDILVRDAACRALRTGSSGSDYENSTINGGDSMKLRGQFYDTLGIKLSATTKDVKSAYRKLAAAWHPDKWTMASAEDAAKAEAKFKTIQRAYATLSDVKQRRLYDADPKRFDSEA